MTTMPDFTVEEISHAIKEAADKRHGLNLSVANSTAYVLNSEIFDVQAILHALAHDDAWETVNYGALKAGDRVRIEYFGDQVEEFVIKDVDSTSLQRPDGSRHFFYITATYRRIATSQPLPEVHGATIREVTIDDGTQFDTMILNGDGEWIGVDTRDSYAITRWIHPRRIQQWEPLHEDDN